MAEDYRPDRAMQRRGYQGESFSAFRDGRQLKMRAAKTARQRFGLRLRAATFRARPQKSGSPQPQSNT